MSGAQELATALKGRCHGRYWMARCPAHRDRTPSLKIEDGDLAVLLHCFAGCSQDAIISALKVRGLWQNGRDRSIPWTPPKRKHDDGADRTAKALAIWRNAVAAPGSPVEKYLRWRGIIFPVSPILRYHASALYDRSGLCLPCMVAAVQAPDRRVMAIHRTFIRADGKGKAGVSTPKMALGPLGSGAVRLGPAGPVLGIAEGIETALSAAQLFGVTCWAALGARLASVELPPEVRELQIFGDNGEAGHRAAEKAAEAFTAQSRRVFLRFPPDKFGDFNDLLRARVAA